MKIEKKDGSLQAFNPNKVLNRIKKTAKGLKNVDSDILFQKVMPFITDGLTTNEIDELIAYKAADMIIEHPEYSTLGGRILLSNQAKRIKKELQEVDDEFDFFGASVFLKNYSARDNEGKPLELPSMMYERIARHLADTPEEYEEFVEELKSRRISGATPIMTNSGIEKRNNLISCNISTMISDSIEGIEETLKNIAYASKEGSGIGILCDNIRSKESLVSSFNGNASGIVRLADMIQSKMRFYKQGQRSGSAAMYLSVWHRDILDFLELKLPIGDEKLRTRDLFLAVVVNDNFMDALINNKDWYLFCPNDIAKAGLKPLYNLWGERYEKEYNKAVEMGLGKKVSPKVIWDAIIRSEAETGVPYVFYKDNANRRNMQDNIAPITSSNLCIEFLGVSKPNYTPQCCLGVINLGKHDTLETIAKSTRTQTKLLNKVLNKNKWSDKASAKAGTDQRTIGIGVAGLADFFAKKKIPFTSDEAKRWNKDIFETIYKNAVIQSNLIAEETGESYPAWEGSKYSEGETYIEGWNPLGNNIPIKMANSLLTLCMPSAGGSQLLGVNECFEPFTSNIMVRNVGGGEFIYVNKHLVQDLQKLGLWTKPIINKISLFEGSIQNIDEIPQNIKDIYKTVFEIPQKEIINMAADRQQFIDMSQSMNLYFKDVTYNKISSALKYGWEKGLKTGVYYVRTEKASAKPKRLFSNENVTVKNELPQKPANSPFECFGCSA